MATTSLTRTPVSNGNARTFTISSWIKRGNLSSTQPIFSSGVSGTDAFDLFFQSADTLSIEMYEAGTGAYNVKTVRVFRDPTAWYHVVVAVDTEQGTEADRYKFYVNGTQQTLTEVSDGYPPEDYDIPINQTTTAANIGVGKQYSSNYFDGEMAHTHFIDGTAYAASDFGETDSTSGIWVPKTGPSVTYGTNGFFLKYQDTSNFGDDSSGNTNDLTLSGTMTQTKDTPMNNFATMNPLNDDNLSVDTAFAYGNLQITKSNKGGPTATMGVTKGKWYWEIKAITVGADIQTGIYDPMYTTGKNYVEAHVGASNHGYGLIHSNGNKIHSGSNSSYGSGISADDIIMHALDMDNKKWWAGKNGTWFASGDPAAGTNEAYSTLFSAYTGTNHFITPCIGTNSASETGVYQFNFGNGYFGTTNVTSAVADGDGEGRFEYTPPTGFYALCTNNLATYG